MITSKNDIRTCLAHVILTRKRLLLVMKTADARKMRIYGLWAEGGVHRCTNIEFADMHLVYGTVNWNGYWSQLKPLWRCIVPVFQQQLSILFFMVCIVNWAKWGVSTHGWSILVFRKRAIRTRTQEEAALSEVENDPRAKTWCIAIRVRATQSSIRRILYANEFNKYHVQRVQSLTATAYQHRLDWPHCCQQKTIAVLNFFFGI